MNWSKSKSIFGKAHLDIWSPAQDAHLAAKPGGESFVSIAIQILVYRLPVSLYNLYMMYKDQDQH